MPAYPMLQTLFKNAAVKYYTSLNLDDEELKEKISNFTFESLRNSRRLNLLAKGKTVQEVMDMLGDKNYMSTYKFKKICFISLSWIWKWARHKKVLLYM